MWILILIFGVIALTTAIGYAKGFVKLVISVASLIVTLVAVWIFTPTISNALKSNDTISASLQNIVDEKIVSHIDFSLINEDKIIDELNLPEVVKEMLKDNNTLDKYVEIGANNFKEYLVNAITDLIFNAIVFVASFIIIFIAVRLLFGAMKLFTKLPLVHEADKIIGTLVGFAEGLILVWIFFAVATMMSSSDWAQAVFEQVNANRLLSIIYGANPILKYLLSF